MDAIDLAEARRRLGRRAIVMQIGGFRPPDDPTLSWFGRVNVAAPGESWPRSARGAPMHALCQIDLTGLPFRPPRLDDAEMIAVFIGPDELPTDTPNGDGWCLRAYERKASLVTLPPVDTGSWVKPFPMRPVVVDADYPCREDVGEEVSEEIADLLEDELENVPGLKLGGWPSLIQSEIFWAPWNRHPAKPEYVFQIDSDEKALWAWGHGGVGYFGRGTTPEARDEWALAWQTL